jgi:glutathione S-transferase
VQRVWIALEAKGISYQYIEVDPYSKPESLLAINPLGLVPALQHGLFTCHESSVLLEYIEEYYSGPKHATLHGATPQARAIARLWTDHIAKKIIPAFYRVLQFQELAKQAGAAKELQTAIDTLVNAAHPDGPFFAGNDLGFVDVFAAPWMLRFARVLAPYRGWPAPDPSSRWAKWLLALENEPAVRATTSTNELYLDSYERYAGEFGTENVRCELG